MTQKKDIPRVKLDDTIRRKKPTGKKPLSQRAATLQEAQQKDQSSPYEEWSKQDLYDRATEAGVEGRARMSRRDLINTLRDY